MAKERCEFSEEEKKELLAWANILDTTNKNQGSGVLCRCISKTESSEEFEYCCLGVYAESKNPDVWDGYWDRTYVPIEDQNYCLGSIFYILGSRKVEVGEDEALTEYDTGLPPEFAERLGFLHKPNTQYCLEDSFVQLNDDFEYTFKEIAEEIRHLATTGFFTEKTREKLGG